MRAKRKPLIKTSEKEVKVKAEDSAKVDETKTPKRKNMYKKLLFYDILTKKLWSKTIKDITK